MLIQKDFEDLLELLSIYGVRYLIVGSYALDYHGYSRNSDNIDIFFENTRHNNRNIIKTLAEYGLDTKELSEELFLTPGNIIAFGEEPAKVNLVNDLAGIPFSQAWSNHIRKKYGDIEVKVIGKDDLIKYKSLLKRPIDHDDIQGLLKSH